MAVSQDSDTFDTFDTASSDSDDERQASNSTLIGRLFNYAPFTTTNRNGAPLDRRSNGDISNAPITTTSSSLSSSGPVSDSRNRNQKEIHLTPVVNEKQQWYMVLILMTFCVIFAAVIINFMCRLDKISARLDQIEMKIDPLIKQINQSLKNN